MGGQLYLILLTGVILFFSSGVYLIQLSQGTIAKWGLHTDRFQNTSISTLSLVDPLFEPSVNTSTAEPNKSLNVSVAPTQKVKKLNAYERGLLEKEQLREKFLKEWIQEQEELRLYPGRSPKNIIYSPVVSGLGNMLATLSEAIVLSWVTHRRLRMYRYPAFVQYFDLPLTDYYLPNKTLNMKGSLNSGLSCRILPQKLVTAPNVDLVLRTTCKFVDYFTSSGVYSEFLNKHGFVINPKLRDGNDIRKMVLHFVYTRIIQTKPDILALVEKEKEKLHWSDYYWIGLHIRTGHMPGDEGLNTFMLRDDLEMFNLYGEQQTELAKNKTDKPIRWFVAADNRDVRDTLMKRHPEYAVTTSCQISHSFRDVIVEKRSEGMLCTLLDNYLLSNANELIITSRSTYGILAAYRDLNMKKIQVNRGDWRKRVPPSEFYVIYVQTIIVAGDSVVDGGAAKNKVLEGYEVVSKEGTTENEILNGQGTVIYKKDGQEFTLNGTWENGKLNGDAELLNSDSILFMKLHFVNDLIDGEGSLFDNGQVTFKGTWKEGQRCGFCQEYKGGKLVFKGEYSGDVRNGFGIEYDASGEIVFEGEWVNGTMGLKSIIDDEYGNRVLVEKDMVGSIVFMGGFKDGTVMRDGRGTEYENSKPVRECMYLDGVEERVIKEFKDTTMIQYDSSNHKVYEGQFEDFGGHGPCAQGEGKLFEGNVVIYKGEFVRGHRQGPGCSYYPSRTLQYDGDWMNDKANGHGKFYDTEGLLIVEGEFVDDVCVDGTNRIHRDTGKIERVKSSGCFCFGGSRRAGTKQLPIDGEGLGPVAVSSPKELEAASARTPALCFKSGGFGDSNITSIDLTRFSNLRRLTIEANALPHVKTLRICELPKLRTLCFEKSACVDSLLGSEYLKKEYTIKGVGKTLCIESCPLLEEITFEEDACGDFVKCQLFDLPALKTLAFGSASANPDQSSNCFYWCESLQLTDLSALETLVFGNTSFHNVTTIAVKDMPALTSIEFGFEACCGLMDLMEQNDRRADLRLLPALTKLHLHSNALKNMTELRVSGLGALTAGAVTMDEGALAGLKSLKHGADVSEEVLDKLKEDKEIKMFKLKK